MNGYNYDCNNEAIDTNPNGIFNKLSCDGINPGPCNQCQGNGACTHQADALYMMEYENSDGRTMEQMLQQSQRSHCHQVFESCAEVWDVYQENHQANIKDFEEGRIRGRWSIHIKKDGTRTRKLIDYI